MDLGIRPDRVPYSAPLKLRSWRNWTARSVRGPRPKESHFRAFFRVFKKSYFCYFYRYFCMRRWLRLLSSSFPSFCSTSPFSASSPCSSSSFSFCLKSIEWQTRCLAEVRCLDEWTTTEGRGEIDRRYRFPVIESPSLSPHLCHSTWRFHSHILL